MKKITLIAFSLIALLSACDKKEKKEALRLAKFEQIGGLNMSDEFNAPRGSIGQPNVQEEDSAFSILAYPVPAMNVQYLTLGNKSDRAMTYPLKIVNAYFKDAPLNFPESQWSSQIGFAGKTINIENLAGNAEEIVYATNVYIAAKDNVSFAIDVTNFKQGFYRVTVDVDGVRKYWSNLWVFRK